MKEHWLLGLLLEFQRDRLGTLLTLSKQEPVQRFRLLRGINYLVSDPELIGQVLIDKDENFKKNTGFWDRFQDIFGQGLLTSEGKKWRTQRSIVAPTFQPKNLSVFHPIISECADSMLSGWVDSETVDIFQELMSATLNIVKRALLGVDTEVEDDLSRLIWELENQFALRINRPFAIQNKWPNSTNRRYWKALKQLNHITRGYVDVSKSRHNQNTLLDNFVQQNLDEGLKLSDRDLRDQVITLILAGHDTTAITLSWMIYLLSVNQSYWSRLREEWGEAASESAPLAFHDLSRLPLTMGVIKETLRLYPAAYIIGREAVRDVNLGGVCIPKGKAVVISPYSMGRDPRYYINPTEFYPERWTADFIASLPRFAFVPFGGGKRTCVGEHFALYELAILLRKIGSQWTTHYFEPSPAVPAPSITLPPKNGTKVKLLKLK